MEDSFQKEVKLVLFITVKVVMKQKKIGTETLSDIIFKSLVTGKFY